MGQITQYLRQFERTHRSKNAPCGLRSRDHHAGGGCSDCVGHGVEGDLLVHLLLAMNAPPGRQHHRQDIGGHQGQTKPTQRRFGRAQCVDCRVKRRLDVFEGSFQGPPLAIQLRHARGRRRLPWHIRQDIPQRLPVSIASLSVRRRRRHRCTWLLASTKRPRCSATCPVSRRGSSPSGLTISQGNP